MFKYTQEVDTHIVLKIISIRYIEEVNIMYFFNELTFHLFSYNKKIITPLGILKKKTKNKDEYIMR